MDLNPELVRQLLVGLAVAAGIWLAGWILARVLLPRLAHLLRKSSSDLDDLLLAALRPHVPLWFLALGAAVGARVAALSPDAIAAVDTAAKVVVIASVTFASAAFLSRTVGRALHDVGEIARTSLIEHLIRGAVIVLGAMMVLSNLGIAITPIITALGVGSLAVALALQPTLANLFAGFYITLARQMRVNDYVELETGQTGFVTDIGWRTTQIRELPNNIVIVPNAKLAELIVKNYSLPENEQSVVFQVGVSYDSDLATVERVTIETARDVLRTVEGGVASFEPFTRYHTFGDSSINFSVILRVQQFTDRFLVTHEFVKRLHVAYEKHGIEIPFPQRVLHVPGAVTVNRPS